VNAGGCPAPVSAERVGGQSRTAHGQGETAATSYSCAGLGFCPLSKGLETQKIIRKNNRKSSSLVVHKYNTVRL